MKILKKQPIYPARNILSINKLYYGGTDVAEKPDLRRLGEPKDFGWGFYCTTIEEQARQWASEKSSQRGVPGVVSVYTWNPIVLNTLRCLEFEDMATEEGVQKWAECCVMNKISQEQSHDFDIIAGSLAFYEFHAMLFGWAHDPSDELFEAIKREIKHSSNLATQQIVFCTKKAIDVLTFQSSYSV